MKPHPRHLEILVLVVIFYSIVTLVLELEFADPEPSTGFFVWSERVVALFFTVEYVVRWVASRRLSYPLRPMAVIDLLAILPFYFGFLVDLRALRLVRAVRVVRLLKLYRYTTALQSIWNAFHRVRYEFGVLGFAVVTLAGVFSVAMYELEREAQPQAFAKLSDAGWYSIVSLTTVGYGDKVPVTTGGRLVAVVMMLAGLGLFGTFISLIGGAFLEELRKAPRPGGPAPVTADSPAPNEFNPGDVLKALDNGDFSRRGEEGTRDMARLLAIACRLVERAGPGPPTDERHGANTKSSSDSGPV